MDAISKVEFFCADKDVGKVCRSLMGLANAAPKITPCVNAAVGANGEIKPATNGKLLGMFKDHLAKKKIGVLVVGDLKAFVRSVGRVESAYVALRKHAQEAGVIKRTGGGKNARYVVLGKQDKQKKVKR